MAEVIALLGALCITKTIKMTIAQFDPETWFIETIANYLAKEFIKPLFLFSAEKKYPAYVGGLAEILDWAIEFYERYYDKLVNRVNVGHGTDHPLKIPALQELVVAFGNEKIAFFYAEYADRNSCLMEKYFAIDR